MKKYSGQQSAQTKAVAEPARGIVHTNGGNVQGVIAEHPGVEVMIVDYDNEREVPQSHRRFQAVGCDARLFQRTVAGRESDEVTKT